jgi:hypothetical protein
MHSPIIRKQQSNGIATRQYHVRCLIQQHSIVQCIQKYVCTSIICSAKNKNLNEMLIIE